MIGAPVTAESTTEFVAIACLAMQHALHAALPLAMATAQAHWALAFGNGQAGRVLGNGIESPCDISGVDRLARMYR
jgi:hypothetical protein